MFFENYNYLTSICITKSEILETDHVKEWLKSQSSE